MLLLGLKDNMVTIMISNAFSLTGTLYYWLLTFRGYAILPFIRKPEYFLMPVPFFFASAIILTMFKTHLALYNWSEEILSFLLFG